MHDVYRVDLHIFLIKTIFHMLQILFMYLPVYPVYLLINEYFLIIIIIVTIT